MKASTKTYIQVSKTVKEHATYPTYLHSWPLYQQPSFGWKIIKFVRLTSVCQSTLTVDLIIAPYQTEFNANNKLT